MMPIIESACPFKVNSFFERSIAEQVVNATLDNQLLASIAGGKGRDVLRPAPEPLLNLSEWYEEGKIHEALVGCMVRSKSEVIIANQLAAAQILFGCEVPLFAPDGTFYLPDFTIEWRGSKFYWEHLGLLDKSEYKKKWEEKKKWYAKHFPGALLVTEESPRLSKTAQKLIKDAFV